MILFPGDSYNNQVDTTFQGGYGALGGSERFGTIDANIINVNNVNATTVSASWVYAGNLSANQITSDTLNADRIAASSITAAKLNVSTLAAITANMGNVVVGGSADALGTLVVKNSSGTEISKLNSSGIIVRNSQGLFFESTSAGNFFKLQNNGSSQAVVSLPSSNQFFMQNNAENTNLFTVSSSNGGYLDKQGYIMGNGSSDDTKPRVIKVGTSSVTITADSYGDITINFGYTFGASNPFVTATVSNTTGTLGGVHEWNVGLDSFSTSGCHAKCRHVNYANGTGDISVDWIAIGRTS